MTIYASLCVCVRACARESERNGVGSIIIVDRERLWVMIIERLWVMGYSSIIERVGKDGFHGS